MARLTLRDFLAVFVGVALVAVLAGIVMCTSGSAQAQESTKQSLVSAFGSELVVFNGEVRSTVELTKVSGSSINAPVIANATEYGEGIGPLRPGQSYYMWVVGTNYLPDSQGRSLEVWVESDENTPTWLRGRSREDGGKQSIEVHVWELITDPVTLHEFAKVDVVTKHAFGSANSPIIFEGEEAKTFLVRFKLEDDMHEGIWNLSLRLR